MQIEDNRISRAELYLKIAQLLSLRATCKRLSVGCIIARDNRIISSGYNGPLPSELHCDHNICNMEMPCTKAVHAEQNAIMYAAKSGISLVGTILYCTHIPCEACAKLIVQAGVGGVTYANDFRNNFGLIILRNAGLEIIHNPCL